VRVGTDSEGYFATSLKLPVKDYCGYLIHLKLRSAAALMRTLFTDLAIVCTTSFTRRKPEPDCPHGRARSSEGLV
jgi:hypothetical protein